MSVITLPPWADTSPASRQRPRSPVGLERLSLRLPSCCSCPATNTAATQLPERFWKAEIVSAPQEIPGIGERRAVCRHTGKVSPWCSCSRPSGRVLPSCPPLAATSAGGGGSSPPPGAAHSEVSSKTHTRAASLHVWSLGLRRAHK